LACAQELITGPCFISEADSSHLPYHTHLKMKFNVI